MEESEALIKLAELEKRLDVHLKYQYRALEKAESELHARLAGMNEFREQLKEQAARFVTMRDIRAIENSLDKRIQANHNILTNWSGRMWMLGTGLALLSGLVASIVSWIMKT